jgi:endonuclease/exonuclease/phosphatase family metal-dependent hydrolase
VPRSEDQFYNQLQISDVAGYLNPRAATGTAIVLGGDFNATPGQLGSIYASGSGEFREVDDPQNESTHSSGKIDYIFVNQQRFYNLTGDATATSVSDHLPLRGTATVTS